MKRWVPFLCAVCSRLLARQGLPFVNEFPERQQLSRPHCSVYVCVCDYVHKHMFAVRGRHSLSSERAREKQRNVCWELQLVLQSCCFCCLWLCSVCIRACVCVACVAEWIEAKGENALSLSANKNEGGSDVGERLHNLILLLKAYGIIMGLIKLIERVIQIHLWIHQLIHWIASFCLSLIWADWFGIP